MRANRVRDRLQVSCVRVSSSAGLGASSSISCVIRTPRSTDGSYSKASCGVRFSRSSRASAPAGRRAPPRARPGCSRRFFSPPSTLTKTRRVPEIGRGLDAGDGDEADARVLELADRLGEHLAKRLVDAAHPLGHVDGSYPTSRADDLALDESELPLARGEVALGVVEQPLGLAVLARHEASVSRARCQRS